MLGGVYGWLEDEQEELSVRGAAVRKPTLWLSSVLFSSVCVCVCMYIYIS